MPKSRYPDNWEEIALKIKEKSGWRCAKCGMLCLKPNEKVPGLTKSERMKRTLQVHHRNYTPEENCPENLICLCCACHLEMHTRKRGNVSVGQLSLFD